MEIEFIIHAPPTGKARPRVTSHGTYTPKATRDFETLVRLEYKSQGGKSFEDRPVAVYIIAYYAVPKGTARHKASLMLADRLRPTKKPDADNIAKAICDALNGIAYNDDSQITALYVRKAYGSEARATVTITDVEEQHG
jgi:Holliday junction resolvase RusA-like endonuclease